MSSDFSHSITISYRSYVTDCIFIPLGGDGGITGGGTSFLTIGSGDGGGCGGGELAHLHKTKTRMYHKKRCLIKLLLLKITMTFHLPLNQ